MENWMVQNKRADFNALAARFDIDPVMARVIVNRGADTEEKMDRFLNGTEKDLYDPHLLKDGDRAAALVAEAVKDKKGIAIASDFDVDGIFAGSILYEALCEAGADVEVFTPDRVQEGYGLNRRIVDDAVSRGMSLLLTCDNGIAAFDAVSYAKEKGMTVVITDHHEIPHEEEAGEVVFRMPDADAVVDPWRRDCPYPFKKICGAVVAFKVMHLVYERMQMPVGMLKKYYAYAAMATVADVMDLTDENRIIVKIGLAQLNHPENIGLKALIEACGLQDKEINAYHIGFVLGPCFNAAGRLETVSHALGLLQAANKETACCMAQELKELNDRRKNMTLEGTQEARRSIEEQNMQKDKVLVIYLPHCHESLAGIIAGRIREEYHRPTLVITGEHEVCKGSGRSIEAYHMYEGLNKCKNYLLRFGGHPMAAGFSLYQKDIPELRRCLNEQAELTEEDFIPVVRIDVPMPPRYASLKLAEEMTCLEPCGKANPRPLFAGSRFRVEEIRIMGKNRNAIKLCLSEESGEPWEGILFEEEAVFKQFICSEFGEEQWDKALMRRNNKIQLAFVYEVGINEYKDTRRLQFLIRNYRAIKTEKKEA